MLCLALVGTLALSTPEAHARIPGTRLRFGMLESQLVGLGAFADVASDAAGLTARQGPTKLFGIPGQATLYLSDRRLVRMRFEAAGVSRHSMDYVEDQLRRLRMARTCEPPTSTQNCNWAGGGLAARIRYAGENLDARFEPLVPFRPAADTGRIARPAPAPPRPAPSRATSPAPATPAPATSARPPAPSPSSPPAAAAVTTLPETLTISLVSKNAPGDWPRIVSSPRLEYPEAARRESVQGVVWVLALVNPDGSVRRATVPRGIRELDAAAIAWVSGCRFAPCERQGIPCRFHVRVAVRFTLH